MIPPLKNFQNLLRFGDFGDIYLEESKSLSLRWEEGKVESILNQESSGAGLRFLNGNETRFGHADLSSPLTGELNRAESERLEKLAAELKNSLSPKNPQDFLIPAWKIQPIQKNPGEVSLDQKMELLKKTFQAANSGAHIRQVTINYGEKTKKIGYLNSLGESFLEERTYLVLSLTVTVEKDKEIQTAYESMGGITGMELFGNGKAEALARLVCERAHKKLEAPQAPVGTMTGVIT